MRARIELTRIDNRLVHGQVGLTWGSTLNIDTIVVVDNRQQLCTEADAECCLCRKPSDPLLYST